MQQGGKPDPDTGLRVLLVEDEIMVALLLEEMLGELGHTVIGPAGQLRAAIEMARQAAVDVAILDVNLNGQEVYPVAETLAGRDIPFLFSTGYGSRVLPAPYRNRPTLQKPFLLAGLRQALTQACATRRA